MLKLGVTRRVIMASGRRRTGHGAFEDGTGRVVRRGAWPSSPCLDLAGGRGAVVGAPD
jgi:hypothetical protein